MFCLKMAPHGQLKYILKWHLQESSNLNVFGFNKEKIMRYFRQQNEIFLGRVDHLPLLVFVVGANEDCLWYVDKNGTWHNGFDCPLITFCCGNCHRRYCCLDAFKMITEREQKRCMLFQFR